MSWHCAQTAPSAAAADLEQWQVNGRIDAALILAARGAQTPAPWLRGAAWGAHADPD